MKQEIIIVHKDTNLTLHGHRMQRQVDAGRIDKEELVELHHAHQQHVDTLETLRHVLHQSGVKYREVSRGSSWPQVNPGNVIITVGGDGTILYAGQHLDLVKGNAIIGIRSSSSSVGYLCAYSFDEVHQLAKDLKDNTVTYKDVHRLNANIQFADDRPDLITVPVLNDFLFTNSNPAATTRYRIHFGDRCEKQKSSGVWIATATGSTAGISAAGGTPMERDSALAQFRVRELFQPPNETLEINGGIFDPDQISLRIENYCESAMLAVDGQHGSVTLDFGDTIRFQRGTSIKVAVRST